jgi:hypothetical protein
VTGYADASFKPYQDTATSVGGHTVFLNDAPIAEKSKLQQSTTLSVTEAESTSGIDCAQDMLFAMRVLESIGLRVNKTMMLTIDNKGAVDCANNWSTGGRMRHSVIKLSFLRELKEAGLIEVNWCKSEEMPADLFTKKFIHLSIPYSHDNLLWRRRIWMRLKWGRVLLECTSIYLRP